MSIQKGGKVTDILYVGVQKRKVPLVEGQEPQGFVYTISKDNNTIYGAPVVTLTVGQRYKFIIDTPGHPFYITTDDEGAGVTRKPTLSLVGAIQILQETKDSLGNVGIQKGVLTWTPSKEHAQMTLYYQCNFHKKMGNEIKVVMPKNQGF